MGSDKLLDRPRPGSLDCSDWVFFVWQICNAACLRGFDKLGRRLLCDLISLCEVNLGSLCFSLSAGTVLLEPGPPQWRCSMGGGGALINRLTCIRMFHLVCFFLATFKSTLATFNSKLIPCVWKRLKRCTGRKIEAIPTFSLYRNRQLDICSVTSYANMCCHSIHRACIWRPEGHRVQCKFTVSRVKRKQSGKIEMVCSNVPMFALSQIFDCFISDNAFQNVSSKSSVQDGLEMQLSTRQTAEELNFVSYKSQKSDFGRKKTKQKANKQGIVVFSKCKSNSSSQCICVGLFSAVGLGVLAETSLPQERVNVVPARPHRENRPFIHFNIWYLQPQSEEKVFASTAGHLLSHVGSSAAPRK